MTSDCLPFFPPELERAIFESAAELYPDTIPSLLLVSQRVNEWIERVKYNTVTPSGSDGSCRLGALQRAVQSDLKPATFFHDRVRHLFVRRIMLSGLEDILSACSGIRSLVLMDSHSSGPSLLPSLAATKPRRLCFFLEQIFGAEELIDLSHSMFTSVTHLDLFDIISNTNFQSRWLNLAILPALTHLSSLELEDPFVGTELLSNCKKLEVLVCMRSDGHAYSNPPSIDDVRFVCMVVSDGDYQEDWIIGTKGGMDFWARADAFVAKRRHGEIKPAGRFSLLD